MKDYREHRKMKGEDWGFEEPKHPIDTEELKVEHQFSFPEKARGTLDIDPSTYYEMMAHCFGNDLKVRVSRKKKELKRVQSYQFGGKHRLHIEQLIYWEDLYYHQKSYLKLKLDRAMQIIECAKKCGDDDEDRPKRRRTKSLDDLGLYVSEDMLFSQDEEVPKKKQAKREVLYCDWQCCSSCRTAPDFKQDEGDGPMVQPQDMRSSQRQGAYAVGVIPW